MKTGSLGYIQKKMQSRLEYSLQQKKKTLYALTRVKKPGEKKVLFILGCQRSGTTLMSDIFDKDLNAKVYPERSPLSNQDKVDRLRLNPLPEVRRTLEASPFPLAVLKPLVESQNSCRLLDYFPGSRAIWMFRHYTDVANSNLRRFGMRNGIRNLRYIVHGPGTNWRAERLPQELRKLVTEWFSEEMNPYDAAALFWYTRNFFFFEQGLGGHPRVLTCKYDELVTSPLKTMQEIYHFIEEPFPGEHIIEEVHDSSVGKGREIPLSPEIRELCDEMWNRLEEVHANRTRD